MAQQINLKAYYDASQAAYDAYQKKGTVINALFETGQTAEALKQREELDKLKDAKDEAERMYQSMKALSASGEPLTDKLFAPAAGAVPEEKPREIEDVLKSREYLNKFFDALRKGVTPRSIHNGMHRPEDFMVLMDTLKLRNALSGDGGDPVGEDGGFLQPVDFDNKIHELQRSLVDLQRYFNVEPVNSYSGWRVIEQAAVSSGFAALTPQVTGAVTEVTGEPKFNKVEYTIADYAGYLPIANDVMADTPIALMNYVARWASKKELFTINGLILAIVNAITPTDISLKDLEDTLRTTLNSTLDPACSANAIIMCNQSGFDLLDQLEDGQGRPFLQPDPTQPTLLRYKGREIVKVPSSQWANPSNHARFAVGWGQEALTLFRRQSMQFDSTNIGGNAWRYNNTEVRCILRAVAKAMDSSAMALITCDLT